jgi:hypothetical protein
MILARPRVMTMRTMFPRRMFLLAPLTGLLLLAGAVVGSGIAGAEDLALEELAPADVEFFEKKIRPVLVDHCYECHSQKAEKVQGGLLLDNRAAVARGGDSGASLVAGKPDESLLYQALQYGDESFYQMPPAGKLPAEVIADFAEWIRRGAPDPREGEVPELNPEAAVDHWAFEPPQAAPLPEVAHGQWPRTDLDRHVLATLEQQGLQPSAQADRRTYLRRVTFDLIGLPPTAEQMAEFAQDSSPEAYAKVVDRLLASPHFGERWARHWLDVARYSDTKGYVFQEDRNYPEAYTYRDWVVRALNEDMPYDQFVRYQLAADSMPSPEGRNDLPAMGFLTLGRRFLNRQPDIIDDRIDVTMRGLQGLTVSCARCHDHKFDPIPTADYYSLYGVFASSEEPGGEPSALRMVDKSNPHDERIFIRGNHRNRGEVVPRRFLECLSGEQREPYREGSGRRQLAEDIVSPDNPLTARVLVNRVWMHLFGSGLVDTPSDFGVRTSPPTQVKALDYLATRFMQEGWAIKPLIREIVLSQVYRQSSAGHAANAALDPENRSFWRMNRRRLDFEAQRDSLLAAAGTLDRTVGGKAVQIAGEDPARRRTLYGFIDRQNLPSLFRSFDFASPDAHVPERHVTTVPQQALYLLNNEFVQAQAEALAERVADDPPAVRIDRMYGMVFQRPPSEAERRLALDFVAPAPAAVVPEVPLWQFGYGELSDDQQRVASFETLRHWTGSQWQVGGQLPDPVHGWVCVNAEGGHPGNDAQHAAIRRFTAPTAGVLSLTGTLKHRSDQGDGVRARLVSNRQGLLGSWQAADGGTATDTAGVELAEGEQLNFVVDCLSGPNHDSFSWTADLQLAAADSNRSWSTADGFHGPRDETLDRWALLAQALLLSNEFVFVD